jgi:hypothetical protein
MIARVLVRGGLLTLALTAAMATASVCRIMRSPSPSDSEAPRTDPSEYLVDLRQTVRRDPPSLIVRDQLHFNISLY